MNQGFTSPKCWMPAGAFVVSKLSTSGSLVFGCDFARDMSLCNPTQNMSWLPSDSPKIYWPTIDRKLIEWIRRNIECLSVGSRY